MGKATRWLKGLFSGGGGGGGGKKSKLIFAKTSNKPKNEVSGDGVLGERSGPLFGSFGSGGRGGGSVGGVEEESNRAIAMAAATAAVAEAAVAAAQAAAVVVRLTSSGRVCRQVTSERNCEDWAAVRIQAVFRGYLARRALKALKGLVKLQALVRGHIVRKQTLRCMQALVRVQARARAYRVLADNDISQNVGGSCIHHPQGCSTCTRDKHVGRDYNDSRREMPATLLRKVSGANYSCSQHSNLNWLDNWMEQRYSETSHTMQLRGRTSTIDDEKNAKILEIDTGKTNFNSKRRIRHHSMSSDQNSRSLMTMADSPSKDSTIAHGSIPSPSSVEMQPHLLSPLRFQYEPVESSESSQQLYSASSRHASSKCGPFTPSKSDCSRSFLSGYTGHPNYMAYTESSKAKARSQSAPRQRPPEFEKSCNMKRVQQTLSSGCSGASACCQSSTSSHGSSFVKFPGKVYHSSGRLDRMGMPIRI